MAKKSLFLKKYHIMRTPSAQFKDIVDTIYELPLDVRLELKNLLELNIAEARREEISMNYKKSQKELESGILEFSSNPNGCFC
jgi:hypothetical protein